MLARFAKWCGVAVILVLLAAPSAMAQATGKIQGRVVDAGTGAPVAGATISLLGTSRSAVTTEDGYYFMNEVPAGLQTIVVEFIGRRTMRLEGQRVLAGQTTTLDFQLEVAAIELEPLIVEGERNPLVPRDQVSSKSIVTGELIDALPIDDASIIVLLQPGVIFTNQGRTIRGSRPNEEAVYVDGVLTRRYGTGQAEPIELPTNALAQVDVTTGGIGAQFSEAQSGVVNYVTRSGGMDFGGTFTIFTDLFSPKQWRQSFNRVEATFGGPLWRDQNLTFFLAGQVEGRRYMPVGDGWNDVPLLLNDGVAAFDESTAPMFGAEPGDPAVFFLPRSSTSPDGEDSVRVAFPNFTQWDNGPNHPFRPRDEYVMLAKVNWGIGSGTRVDLSYKRNRTQRISLGIGETYNPDGFDAFFSTADVFTLGGYFMLMQKANSALALDLKASYQSYNDKSGEPDPDWLLGNNDPALGFNTGNIKFLVDSDDWPITDQLMQGSRSGVIPQEELQVFPGRFDLDGRQSLPGLTDALRLNPYGMRRNFDIGGFGNGGLDYTKENDWFFNATLDWQAGRYFRLQAGGDLGLIHAERRRIFLFTRWSPPNLNDPTRAGLFATGRLDLGDVVIDAGLRWDYFDADGEYPRIPGFVNNVPDSLKADFWRVAPGDGPSIDRLEPLADCGGDATAPSRRNPETGQLVCKNNFVRSSSKSELSPRLLVAFPVTVKSTFRLSYSHNVQVPPLGGSFGGVVSGQVGLYQNMYDDLVAGLANTNTDFGRDVDLPRTVLFEAGFRQLIGEDLVVDVAAYSKTTRNGLTIRKVQYEDPNIPGQQIFINSVTNADYTQIRGVDLVVNKRFGQFANLSTNYSFIDARGTGSDPFTYIDLLFRRNTNLSIITQQPVIPPDVILPLEQSRAHNFAGTFALSFPRDFQQGTVVGSIFGDFGTFITFFAASGLRFTRLQNSANGQAGPPTFAGLGGTVAEELNSSSMPWELVLDARFTKGFRLGKTRLIAFVDWRNPFNIQRTDRIFLETGTAFNEAFQEKQVNQQLTDPLLDGDTEIRDFNIARESIDNPVNVFALLQAEKRYGNGDGVFTVAEQRRAFDAFYGLFWGPQNFVTSLQNLRLGLEINF